MTGTLGIATIGQAPRDDIVAQVRAQMPTDMRVVLRGCFDGLTPSEVARFSPQTGDDVLYSRLADGTDITLAKRHAIARAPETLAKLRADGAGAILFACTGAFPDSLSASDVVFPSRVLAALAGGLLPKGRLGLIVPLEDQVTQLPSKWRRPGLDVVAEPLIPSGGEDASAEAGRRMATHKPDLVVMDCMSYGETHRGAVRRVVGVPTLLAISTMARVLREMLA
jgi:protein AroM